MAGPRSPIKNINYKVVGDASVESGREESQLQWYDFAGKFCMDKTVLDVGCGLAKGVEILSKTAKAVYGIDLDERLKKDRVFIRHISEVETKSVDIVTAIDVIEHVENDIEFVNHLIRVARKEVIVSTPNYTYMRCSWPYHIREYTPREFVDLFTAKGEVHLYKGSHSGDIVFEVKDIRAYFIFNELRVHTLSSFLLRCLNKIVPYSMKIHPHLCVRVLLH